MAKSVAAKDVKTAWVLTGLLTIVFGVATIFWPGLTLLVLVYLVGAYLLVMGIVHVFHGISLVGEVDSWWYLTALLGVVELGFGVYILRHPVLSFTKFIALLGFVLIIRGVVEVVAALFSKFNSGTSRMLTAVSGVLAVAVGIVILDQKQAAGVAFVWILGVYAIIVGCISIAAAREIDVK